MAGSEESIGVSADGGTSAIEVEDGSRETLYGLLRCFLARAGREKSRGSLISRLRSSFLDAAPLLREASANSARDLLAWTRRGSPLRALLVISVGTVVFIALTGFLVFMLFFLAATLNAIIISLLMSVAAAGGFLAFFFVSMTVIYIGALSVAFFAVSAITISAIIAAVVATGWVGFFWILWLAATKILGIAKRSLSMTGSALSAYSAARKSHLDGFAEAKTE